METIFHLRGKRVSFALLLFCQFLSIGLGFNYLLVIDQASWCRPLVMSPLIAVLGVQVVAIAVLHFAKVRLDWRIPRFVRIANRSAVVLSVILGIWALSFWFDPAVQIAFLPCKE